MGWYDENGRYHFSANEVAAGEVDAHTFNRDRSASTQLLMDKLAEAQRNLELHMGIGESLREQVGVLDRSYKRALQLLDEVFAQPYLLTDSYYSAEARSLRNRHKALSEV